MSHELPPAALKSYIATRAKIDEAVGIIAACTHLLSLLKACPDPETEVDLYSLGCLHEMLHGKIHHIVEYLDDFLPLSEAQLVLHKVEKTK